jgi:hypothetical protein
VLRHTGRAAKEVGQTLHHVCHFLLTVAILLSLIAVGGAWRLSRGPVDLGFLKNRIEQSLNNSVAPAHVTIGGVSIAWGGFSHGLDQPLHLRVTDLAIDEAAGGATVHIPVVEAALSARWMLIGRVLPRSITLGGAHLVFIRNVDGSFNFDVGGSDDAAEPSPLLGLLAVLGSPRETDRHAGGGRLSQLSEVAIHGGTLQLNDRLLGMTWAADRADIDLLRHSGGGMDGRATLVLTLGGQRATLAGNFNLAPAGRSVHVAASLSRVTPKALANSAAILAPLAAVDVPLTVDGEADLGPDLQPTHFRLNAQTGAGRVVTETGSIPVRHADFVIAGTLEQAMLEHAIVELQPESGAAISTVGGTGRLTHQAGRLSATLHLTLDHAGFADLPALWPAGIAADARTWIAENIQTGTAHDGKAELVLETPDTNPDVKLLKATASLEGDDVAVTWLPTVPRVEHSKAHLVLTDPDKIEIDMKSAQQKVNGGDPIAIPSGHVIISGLTQKDQVATVQCEANGSIASAIALLKEPRLRILDRHPMELRAPSGDARMSIHAVVPLLRDLRIDDVAIHGTGNLSKVHLSGIVAGRDLDDGALLLDADTSHLSIKGTGRLAGIPANIDGMMDFRAGPPSQVLQRYQVSGRATARALSDAGVDTQDALAGEVGLNVVLGEHRSGAGELTADIDLTQAALNVAPLAWGKPIGGPAKASARLVLSKDKLMGIDQLMVDGRDIQLKGSITVVGGKLDTVRLDRATLGRTDVKGTIRLAGEGPIGVDLAGPALDVAVKLLEKAPKRDPAAPDQTGPAWSIRGRFDRVFLAHDQIANQVVATGESDGRAIRALAVTGRTGSGKPFSLRIGQGSGEKGGTVRRLAIDTEDAGSVLSGLDVTEEIKGGSLTVNGEYDDTIRNQTLSGTLLLNDFRVIHAPALGKLLQAVTLYGLVDALGGPGLNFSRLTAPFQLDEDTLVLRDARAFSPSLGLTAKGRIDRAGDRLDLEGTLVPAYVFNSVLGRIPLIGGLFSPEKGGGLFAMNYSLRGQMDNPSVKVNPLSALTPGFLRGMFGMFDRVPSDRPIPPTPLDRPALGSNAPAQ